MDAMALDGLGPKVEELRELKPQRRDLPMLLDMLSRHDEAKRLVEKEQDYGAAVTILEELPEELRDPELYPRLRSIHERILKLESKIQQARQHGSLPELEASVSALLQMVPHRPDLARLQDWITDHQRAVKLFNSGRDDQTTLELLERIPPDLRDESLYQEVQRKIRISQLEHEIGQEAAAGHFIGLRKQLDQLAALAPGNGLIQSLAPAITINEEARQLAEEKADWSAADTLLKSLPAGRRDKVLMRRVVEHHERIKVLIDKFSASFVDGSTAALQPTLLELSRMTAPQAQSIQLTQLAAQIEPLANAWRRAGRRTTLTKPSNYMKSSPNTCAIQKHTSA